MSGRISLAELIIILVIVLLLFGAKKLPGLVRSLGQSAKEFREGVQEGASGESEESEAPSEQTPDS